MTSNFDNDEIQDSAFPVEFTEDTTSLDMYGVWVKSGPREVNKKINTPLASSDTSEFEELSDIPDFSISSDTSSETNERDGIVFEEIISDPNSFSETVSNATESLAFSPNEQIEENESFDIIQAENFFDIQQTDTFENQSVKTAEADEIEINFEDIRSDEPDSFASSQENEALSNDLLFETTTDSCINENRVFEEIDNFDIQESEFHDPAELKNENVDASQFLTESSMDSTEFIEQHVQTNNDIIDMETFDTDEIVIEVINQEAELEDDVVQSAEENLNTDLQPSGITPPAQILSDEDFSSFLDDINEDRIIDSASIPSIVSTSSIDLDLDSFIDSFNESGVSSEDTHTKNFDDTEPVDIDLDFDESFIADSEKIKATGAAVSESEFFDSEFGVEMIDETSDQNKTKDILSSFTISDLPEMEETDEFNDLLTSYEKNSEIGNKTNDSMNSKIVGNNTDTSNFFQSNELETESNQEEDIDITVFSSDRNDQDFIDIPEIKDYNITESDRDVDNSETSSMEESVSLDFDDINAVEQELNSFTTDSGEETVITNDKSTELLMKIAEELSSIKDEISTLKNELAGFKTSGASIDQVPPSIVNENTENSGFFADDDTDETIALTGDELNNILITADFTEEKNEDTEFQESIDLNPDFDNGFTPEVINDNAQMDVVDVFPTLETESTIDSNQNTISEEIEIPDTLPDSIFEIPEIDATDSIEVAHVNAINEDISYLEGSDISEPSFDSVDIDEPELEIIDFNDEKLEEPELTEFNIDLADIENEFPLEQDVQIPQISEETEESLDAIDIGETLPDVLPDDLFEETIELDTPENTFVQSEQEAPLTKKEEQSEIEKEEISTGVKSLPVDLKDEIKSVLSYMDQLLESLPEDKIEEFAKSEHFEVYKKLFEELGIS